MVGWTKVSGTFVAQGGEQFITIGNFNDNNHSDTIFVRKPRPFYQQKECIYYIDDVSVIHLDADAGKDTTICQGNSILLGRAASPGLTYSWQPATGLSSTTIAQPIANPGITTTYYLTATLNGGCSKFDTVTVTVVNANAGIDTALCKGSSITIGTTGLAGVSYSWQPATGLSNTNIARPVATPTITTTYNLTASLASGCSTKDTITVTVIALNVNAGTDTALCNGTSLILGTAGLTGFTYNWLPITGLNNAAIAQPIAMPTNTTTYTITASANGCTQKDSVNIYILPPVAANAGANVTIIAGTSTTLTGSAIAGSTFAWSPAIYLSCESCASTIASPLVTTSYVLTASKNSCSSSDEVTVYVDIDCGELFVPNAFSPNGDTQNDVLKVFGNCITEIDLVIFNRLGEQVFESRDISIGWDGTYQSKDLDNAVFVYFLTATVNGEKVKKQGNVSIVK